MSERVFEGVPRALVLDGWWMSADTQFEEPKSRPQLRDHWGSRTRRRLVLLLALLALADILFFQQAIGISLAVFAIAIFAAAALDDDDFQLRAGPIVVLALGLLPIVDYVQFFSVVFLGAGVIVSVAWQRFGVSHSVDAVLYATKRLTFYLPLGAAYSIDDWVKSPVGAVDMNSVFKGFVRNWAFPIGGGCLILSLLIAANPVLERLFSDLVDVDWDVQRMVMRVLFWLGMALLIWPIITVPAQRLQRPIGSILKPQQLQSARFLHHVIGIRIDPFTPRNLRRWLCFDQQLWLAFVICNNCLSRCSHRGDVIINRIGLDTFGH